VRLLALFGIVSLRQACVAVATGLTCGSFGGATPACDHPVDVVD
jgi:hypothetical protein